ncbi:hypothetical protein Sango_2829600 [Sesamum angolense]|uniref:Reverse transcriptase domain-containing protein n=1 Tax=Sesamum angolense TaxID=2727404 RepID=A0AAE1T869_9LAMI|nr:hypothetical protein Sango_2829600 [Sesamum angolense]
MTLNDYQFAGKSDQKDTVRLEHAATGWQPTRLLDEIRVPVRIQSRCLRAQSIVNFFVRYAIVALASSTKNSQVNMMVSQARSQFVDIPSLYNAILGHPTLNAFQVVISTYHMKIKFCIAGEAVLVLKPGKKWRMCVDFKDLNKACPIYFYPCLELMNWWTPRQNIKAILNMGSANNVNQPPLKRYNPEEGGGQRPIYYVSKVFTGVEGRYPPIVKMALAIGDCSLETLSLLPLVSHRSIGRFLLKITGISEEKTSEEGTWLLHVDGSTTTQGSRGRIVINSLQGENMEFAIRFEFKAFNNEVEYEAIVLSMRMAQEADGCYLRIFADFVMRSRAHKALALALSFSSKATTGSAVLGTTSIQ